jgi:hypothetical protein
MNKLSPRVSAALWWLPAIAVLAAMIGWETDWGRAIAVLPHRAEAIDPKPIVATVLPEFSIPGGVEARNETVARTLFNPTRRPAPTMAQETASSRLKTGQFALTGTMLVDGKNVALLREIAGNKARRVQAGETINGMRVAEVKADRVKLTVGDESEELILKVATNPRPTPQPVAVAAQPVQAVAATPVAATPVAAVPGTSAAAAAQAPAGTQGAAQSLAERRRAARAAAAAAPPAPAAGAAPPAPGANGWDAINQQYRDRAAGATRKQ